MDKIVVLRNDLCSGSREVQSVRFFRATKVVQLEHEMLGQVALVSPDDPANAGIN